MLRTIDFGVLGARLRDARGSRTLVEVSRLSGLGEDAIASIESGNSITATQLVKLARFYGVSVSSLVSDPLDDPIGAYHRGEITEGQLAEALGCDRLEARARVGGGE